MSFIESLSRLLTELREKEEDIKTPFKPLSKEVRSYLDHAGSIAKTRFWHLIDPNVHPDVTDKDLTALWNDSQRIPVDDPEYNDCGFLYAILRDFGEEHAGNPEMVITIFRKIAERTEGIRSN